MLCGVLAQEAGMCLMEKICVRPASFRRGDSAVGHEVNVSEPTIMLNEVSLKRNTPETRFCVISC